MACNTSITSCPIYPCYENIYIGLAAADTDYTLRIKSSWGKVVTEDITTDSEGFVVITGGVWDDLFNSGGQFSFEVLEQDTNIPVDFRVITGFSGGSYASQQATISTNYYDKILVDFNMLKGSTGMSVIITNQYLFNDNA